MPGKQMRMKKNGAYEMCGDRLASPKNSEAPYLKEERYWAWVSIFLFLYKPPLGGT